MTHYWWMHWFWITYCVHFFSCEAVSTTLHSTSTEFPLHVGNESNRTSKAIGGSHNYPPINFSSSIMLNSSTTPNISLKSTKGSQKKIDYIFSSNLTMKLNNSKVNPPDKELTVINPINVTDVSVNITDNQTLINNSFSSTVNHTVDINYLGEEQSFNQSLIQNSERIGPEEIEEVSGNLTAAGITGITLGCVVTVGIICGVSYVIYRNRGFNRPQVLNDRCSNPDSSGYIDDASVRDNSEEMYSLDNDSFLNSLEAMTIQNYWTDTVKHTKL